FTDTDRETICLLNNCMYCAWTMCINYTTYDVRRDCDLISPQTHPDVMVLSPEEGPRVHKFWYVGILGIFTATVISSHGRRPQRMEFLWVRWFGIESGYNEGPRYARLPKIGIVPHDDPWAFGFLHPQCVVRGCHLIPAFCGGRTQDLLPISTPTVARLGPLKTDDWTNYYISIFVDRDMMMRFFGGGIGHRA
ncbi:hypothetical protein FISHEDRAFT_18325, partial [Fistulina hepatica ATCC 64428]